MVTFLYGLLTLKLRRTKLCFSERNFRESELSQDFSIHRIAEIDHVLCLGYHRVPIKNTGESKTLESRICVPFNLIKF